MNERIEVVVHGRVQMVMYRDFTTRKARGLKLSGEVQNLPNGTVHIVAEGSKEQLEKLIVKLHKGSVLAHVEQVEVKWLPATNEFNSFSINYG